MSRKVPRSAAIEGPKAFERAFRVSRETLERLEVYERLLNQWQKAVNLVAPSTLDQAWHRHFADSAQLAALVPVGAKKLADLGSGGGFPGLVLAIMLAERGGPRVALIEADKRKCAFLREVARQTTIAVDIVTARAENPETQPKVGTVDVVTARAFAPLGRLLELAAPYFAEGTIGLFLKGREAECEVHEAAAGRRFAYELLPSSTDPGGRIVVVRHLGAKQEGRAATGPTMCP
jgi:16S rRNA (guanine527-N7)-methyltransferase